MAPTKKSKRKRPKPKPSFDVYADIAPLVEGGMKWIDNQELTDGEIYAIGLITVLWALLEHLLLNDTAKMANRANLERLPEDAVNRSFGRRRAAWRTLVMETIKREPERDRLLKLHDKIARAENLRHKITHGLWQWYPSNIERLRAYSYRPGVEFDEKHLSFQKLKALVFLIGEINFALSYPPSSRGGVWEEAKRRKARFLKASGGAYWSRHMLLAMKETEFLALGPYRSMLGEPRPQQWTSPESPPKE